MQSLETRARSQIADGNLGAAAQTFRQLADASRGAARSRYLVDAARLLIERMDYTTAGEWLVEAQGTADQEQQHSILILFARIVLLQARPDAALRVLLQIAAPIPIPALREAAEIRGQAYFALGRYADGIREFAEREIWLDDAAQIVANQRSIWDALSAGVGSTPQATGDVIVDGWLALAPLARVRSDPTEFRRQLLEWRRIYTDHPAAGGLLAEMLSEQRATGARPTRIALLLPLSTQQRVQSIAVRDGFLASHLASGHVDDSTVIVYDTAARGAVQAYLQAQLDGADFIVGPLLRPEVDQVLQQSGFVPTLALNWAQVDAPFLQSFYQFGLAPEDEVRAIAQRAIAVGHLTAVALVASDDRGYRLLNNFRAEYEALGGRILGSAGYVPRSQDVSGAITDLLNISRSTQRHRRLQANLGVNVVFEPRRRQDVDMIFLQADSPMGRLLAPNLRFYYAGDIPTYATSEIYEPGNGISDADLNGVMFADVPLLLSPNPDAALLIAGLQSHWPQRASQLIRYYGLGFDAYRLIPALYNEDETAWPMAGVSGQLSVDGVGRVRREVPIAQFRNGRPIALSPPPQSTDRSQEFVGSR
jgi:outer membrane PBP1 activator LpoA protein